MSLSILSLLFTSLEVVYAYTLASSLEAMKLKALKFAESALSNTPDDDYDDDNGGGQVSRKGYEE